MSISWPTKEQWRASILALYKAERPVADSTKYSDLWLNSRIWSVIAYRLGKTVQQLANAVMPGTSFDSYLDTLLNAFGLPDGQGGFGRILPHISSATSALRAVAAGGNIAAGVLLNDELTDEAGNVYKCTEANALILAGNSEDLDVESVTTGYTVNLESGTVLTWTSPEANCVATATLQKDLTGGADLGEDSAENQRLLTRTRYPGLSGNVASWVQTIEAVQPGNLKAFVWPQRQNQPYGYGLTDYMAIKVNELGLDRFIAAADDLYDEIDTAVDAAEPALIYRGSRQLVPTAVHTDLDITIELGLDATQEQKVDWDAEGNKTTVATSVSATGVITTVLAVTSLTVTNGLDVGHRVVIDGVEGIVTAIDALLDTSFTVADWPDGWPTGVGTLVGEDLLAGGGFIGWKTDNDNFVTGSGLIGATQAFVDGRGPNVSYNAAQSQIPGWDSSIRIQQLESECFVVGGGVIVDVAVTAPAADLAHASEDGATALTYYSREILIWQVFV